MRTKLAISDLAAGGLGGLLGLGAGATLVAPIIAGLSVRYPHYRQRMMQMVQRVHDAQIAEARARMPEIFDRAERGDFIAQNVVDGIFRKAKRKGELAAVLTSLPFWSVPATGLIGSGAGMLLNRLPTAKPEAKKAASVVPGLGTFAGALGGAAFGGLYPSPSAVERGTAALLGGSLGSGLGYWYDVARHDADLRPYRLGLQRLRSKRDFAIRNRVPIEVVEREMRNPTILSLEADAAGSASKQASILFPLGLAALAGTAVAAGSALWNKMSKVKPEQVQSPGYGPISRL